MLNITVRDEGSVMILDLAGQIDGGPDSQKVHELIKQKLGAGQKNFVINMKDVIWLNSIGAGMLIAAYVSVKRQDAILKLAGMSDRVRMVLEVFRIIPEIFEVYDTDTEAIGSFS